MLLTSTTALTAGDGALHLERRLNRLQCHCPAKTAPNRRPLSVLVMDGGTGWIASTYMLRGHLEVNSVPGVDDGYYYTPQDTISHFPPKFSATSNNTMFNGHSFVNHSLVLMIVITSFSPCIYKNLGCS